MKSPDHDAVLTDGHGTPIRGVDQPPVEPAGQPTAVRPEPGYGPSPTAQGVRGYRDLSPDDVATINAIKEMQEQMARVWAMVWVRPGADTRWAMRAKDWIEDGVSALVRSIARPHDPFHAALQELVDAAKASGPNESTQDRNPAQPSQDHRPDEGSRA